VPVTSARRVTFTTLTCSLLTLGVVASSAWSQPGTLLSYGKINSDALDAVGAPLDDVDEFGDAVASLGDLDGPGPSVVALAVGAVGDDDGGSHHGAVYVLFLDAAGQVLSYQKISSTEGGFTGLLDINDEFGGAVAGLGDLDGPGPSAAALAVGAVGDDDGGSNAGAVYVLLLGSGGTVLSHQKISMTSGGFTDSLETLDEFGGAVAGLGDLDGAGPSTKALAVGAMGDDDGGVQRGATYILFLGSTGSVLSQTKISNTRGDFSAPLEDNDNLGEDLASLGDFDGTGPSVVALAATAIGDDDGGHDCGAVYVLFLNSTGSVFSYRKISVTQGGFTGPVVDDDNFGTSVTALGNLDGNGPSVAAIAVGAGGDDGDGVDRGAVYVLFLDSTAGVLSYQEISSTAGGIAEEIEDEDEFGSALVALGDLDGVGPGAQTLVSASSMDDDGGFDRGAVYLLSLAGGSLVGIENSPVSASSNRLSAARPNPFRGGTSIPFRISEAGDVRIDILDVRGRLVRELVRSEMAAGEHHVVWDGHGDSGRALAPGAYYLRMSVNGRPAVSGTTAIRLR